MMIQCDFCNSHDVQWEYRAESFVLATLLTIRGAEIEFPWVSEGDWAACEICSSYIEAGNWDALADRSVETSPFLGLMSERDIPILRKAVLRLHRNFNKRRIGHRFLPA